MLGTIARLVLFVSSYAPLLVLFAVLRSFGSGWPMIVCYAVAGASVLGLALVWVAGTRGPPADFVDLAASRNRDSEVMAYLVSYVVPFAAVDASSRTRIALAVFAVLLAALYLRAAVFYIHPLLLIAGLHVYDATTSADVPVILLTRRRFLPQRQRVRVVPLAPGVLVEKDRSMTSPAPASAAADPEAALAMLRSIGPLADAGLRFCVLAPAAAGGLDAYRVDIDTSAKDDLAEIAEGTRASMLDATLLPYAPAALIPAKHAMVVRAAGAALLTAVQSTVDTGDFDAFDPGSDAAARVSMTAARFSSAAGAVVTFYRISETLLRLRRKVLGLVRRNGVYHRLVPADVLLMQPTFDVIVVDGWAFFTSKPKFERAFGFLEQLQATSARTFDQVTTDLRIDGLDALRAAATSNPQMMAKMASIKRSLDDDPRYAQAMQMDRIVPFVRANPDLGIALTGPATAPELVYDPSSNHRYKILNLLDDDYLRSVLTDREYEATSKTRRIT